MADFVLVHGAFHGAWCWDELIPELESRGHRALAIDLPGMGQDRTPSDQVTMETYVERVEDALAQIGEDVWLVGHSQGGAVITQTAERAADHLAGLVYVTALLPLNGQSALEAFGSREPGLDDRPMEITADGSAIRVPADRQRDTFYHLCADAQVERAQRLLAPLQPIAPAIAPMALTDANFGRVPRYYIECLQDRAIAIEDQRRMHQAAGVRAVESLEADHSPFFSCPSELADALDRFAAGA